MKTTKQPLVFRPARPRKAGTIALAPVAPYHIENAACPRVVCGGNVFHGPATNRVYCPACETRQSVAAMVSAAKGGAL